MPRLALAIRHVHFEDRGTLVDVLLERDLGIRYIDVGRHVLRDIDVSTADLVIGLGEVPNQIFEWRNALAFQCHPEVKAEEFERWLIRHACEIDVTAGISVEDLHVQTARFGPALGKHASRVFQDWMTRLAF